MVNQKDKYIKDLEETLSKFMTPLRDVPFTVAIKALSGYDVLAFNRKSQRHKNLLDLLIKAAARAGRAAYKTGIYTNRPNEVGNEIEPFVKNALKVLGLSAETPSTKDGRRKATGYPDIEVADKDGNFAYIECKTYNIGNINTTQRAFYFSPSKSFKVTSDAFHFMLSFQIEKQKRGAYVPTHWKLYTLENLRVDVKHEFNQSNRKLYGSESDPSSLLAEGDIQSRKTSQKQTGIFN